MTEFRPFADDEACAILNGLTVENGTRALAIFGSCEITRDPEGLRRAVMLRTILDDAIAAMESDLPESDVRTAPEAPPAIVEVANPFA